jgi:hypothetical protein
MAVTVTEIDNVVVLYLDGVSDNQAEVFDKEKLVFSEIVPLRYGVTRTVVGRARLYIKDGDKLMADIQVMNENVRGNYFPCVEGRYTHKYIRLTDNVCVCEAEIFAVCLTENENADPRITRIAI